MIEVNLLPDGRKTSRRSFSFSLPSLGRGGGGGSPSLDRWALGAGLVIALALGWAAWQYLEVASEREEIEVALEEEVQDSIRFADLIGRTNELTARRDSIAQKVGIIQEIDQNRFVWPHILDEVARALPDYTWLTSLVQVSLEPLQFRLEGLAGNNFALTVFMEQLEASPFIEGVRLISSEQVLQGDAGTGQVLIQFQLEAAYVQPPIEFLETVPLFGGETTAQIPGGTLPLGEEG